MEYFLLNINMDKESKVDYWINERKFAPIFYGMNTINQIINGETTLKRNQFRDASLFVKTFENKNNDATILSIGEEHIYIYRQDGKLKELENYVQEGKTKGIVKGFQVKIIEKILIKQCPLVLVTIKSNKHMSLGTFKKISSKQKGKSYFGNIKAIEYFISEKKIQKANNFMEYLFCLSSLEFETLIAKMFEEEGYFVPAYKGGFIKNFDLFCTKNDKTISLQIKLEMHEEYYNDCTDLYYCIINNTVSTDKIKTWKNIEHELKSCPKTMEWLKKTLYWIELDDK